MNRTRELTSILVAACEALQALPLEDLPRIAMIAPYDRFGSPLGVRLQLGQAPDVADALIAWADVLPGAEITAHWSCEQPGGERHVGVIIAGELGAVRVEVWTYLHGQDVDDLDQAGGLLGLEPEQPTWKSVPVSLIALSMLRRPTEAVAS